MMPSRGRQDWWASAASWETVQSLCLVLSNWGYFAPSLVALRQRRWYKLWVFPTMLWASFLSVPP